MCVPCFYPATVAKNPAGPLHAALFVEGRPTAMRASLYDAFTWWTGFLAIAVTVSVAMMIAVAVALPVVMAGVVLLAMSYRDIPSVVLSRIGHAAGDDETHHQAGEVVRLVGAGRSGSKATEGDCACGDERDYLAFHVGFPFNTIFLFLGTAGF